jgi:glyoxylase-like metal-dependent hydrolase (beta-lactamase superfamily II)
MKTRVWGIAAAIAVAGGTFAVAAQSQPTAQSVLADLSKAMGADNLRCITYTGNSGYVGIVGQAHDIRDDWPKVAITNYSRTVNYEALSSAEDRTLEQGNYPRIGGGGIPFAAPQRQQNFVLNRVAWNIAGGNANAQPDQADLRMIDIYMSPHGFIKGAQAAGANPVLITRWENGAVGTLAGHRYRKLNIISFTALGKYRINGTINADGLLERIETRIPNPVRGDMNYEAEYSQWKDVNGVKFPGNFHNHTDWDNETQPPNYNGGHNSFGLNVVDVRPNDCGTALSVPMNVANAQPPAVNVTSTQLAPGVFYLQGGTHHSVAVEFKDYVALVESPLNQARALAVYNQLGTMFPNKPVKYVVNSHNHWDHLGGLRTAFHEGSTIITHWSNKDFYKNEVLSHETWSLDPDRLSLYPPTEFDEGYQFETVESRYSLSDGQKILQVFHMQGSPHAEGMVFAYLPAEKIAIVADVYTPGTPPPPAPPAAAVNFYDNIKGYGLEVQTIVGLHGRSGTWAEFLQFVQKQN